MCCPHCVTCVAHCSILFLSFVSRHLNTNHGVVWHDTSETCVIDVKSWCNLESNHEPGVLGVEELEGG